MANQEKNTMEERRTSKRYRVREGAMAFLGTVPGAIVDISEGGMAVHYTLFETGPPRDFRVDIFQSSDNFYLQNLPAELVHEEYQAPTLQGRFIKVKRLSLRFGELTGEQRTRLRYFILHNKICEV